MYSVPVGACVFSVVPWFFNVFPPNFGLVCAYEVGDFFVSSGILGCCGVFLLVQFLCLILLRMSCGRSLSVLRILPAGMCFFPAW